MYDLDSGYLPSELAVAPPVTVRRGDARGGDARGPLRVLVVVPGMGTIHSAESSEGGEMTNSWGENRVGQIKRVVYRPTKVTTRTLSLSLFSTIAAGVPPGTPAAQRGETTTR
eukprot:8431826-Pyramimonas_sp.AAC.1